MGLNPLGPSLSYLLFINEIEISPLREREREREKRERERQNLN